MMQRWRVGASNARTSESRLRSFSTFMPPRPKCSSMMIEVDSLELATLSAVPPERLDDGVAGWLVPMDHGTVGRARSAVPLSHQPPSVADVVAIATRYRQNGFLPVFRLPELPAFAEIKAWLCAQGFKARQPTQVMVAAVDALHPASSSAEYAVRLDTLPDDAWRSVFLGEGFDPVDGASRVGILSRARESRYASIRCKGAAVACGMASFSHGWLGVHGMRTLAAYRGKGMASALLSAMVRSARTRGIERAFLQVDGANKAAVRLYERMGFTLAWTYAYWGQ